MFEVPVGSNLQESVAAVKLIIMIKVGLSL